MLGHHLSLINVQAGVGLHLMDNRPEQAREALTAIKTASAEALREVRAVLGVLRPEEEAAPRQPALGLDRLDELTADAGLPVTTTVTGERRAAAGRGGPGRVPDRAGGADQRAPARRRRGRPPRSRSTTPPAELRLSVRNDGVRTRRAAAAGCRPAGNGIAGMRARAEASAAACRPARCRPAVSWSPRCCRRSP